MPKSNNTQARRARRNARRPRPYNTNNLYTNLRSAHGGLGATDAESMGRSSVLTHGFVIRGLPQFGYRRRTMIPYSTLASVTSGASAAGTYIISANGAFDPDISGSGHQPMAFDQNMQFFNHYTVLRSRIRVVFSSPSTTIPITVAVAITGDPTPLTSIDQIVENGDVQFQQLTYAGQMGSIATIMSSVEAGRYQSTPITLDNPDMKGNLASNPTEQIYYNLHVWNATSATVVTANFQLYVEYDVVFHEPRKGPLS